MGTVTETTRAGLSRRTFLSATSSLAAAALLGVPGASRAQPALETTKVRLGVAANVCNGPVLLAEQLLRLEGFTEVQYVDTLAQAGPNLVAAGHADFTQWDVSAMIQMLDTGAPVLILAGVHPGCQELFASERVRTVKDLKGKRIAVTAMGNGDHIFIATILAYVGIDPKTEVTWVTGSELPDRMELFTKGKADAVMAFGAEPADLRRQKIGHSVVNTLEDKPWSQYFCCMIAASRDYVRANPVAAKRVTRAILKAADICTTDPERAARYVVEKGGEKRFEITRDVIKTLPYRSWRDVNPEDTLRFHALRLHEVGMIKSTPQKLVSEGTDWRFLNELRKELKA